MVEFFIMDKSEDTSCDSSRLSDSVSVTADSDFSNEEEQQNDRLHETDCLGNESGGPREKFTLEPSDNCNSGRKSCSDSEEVSEIKDCDTMSFPKTKNVGVNKGDTRNIPKFSVESLCSSVRTSKFIGESAEIGVNKETNSKKLNFGIDRILSKDTEGEGSSEQPKQAKFLLNHAEALLKNPAPASNSAFGQQAAYNFHRNQRCSSGDHYYSSQCSECYLLTRYCRRIDFGSSGHPAGTSVSTSFTWIPPTHPASPSSHQQFQPSENSHSNSFMSNVYPGSNLAFSLNPSNFATMTSLVSCNSGNNGRRKRSWSRAVFSNLQRKGLEKRFQLQKYITKPDRRQLAATLGLTDAQVKVWFQNRRMKWRHSKEGKQGTSTSQSLPDENMAMSK